MRNGNTVSFENTVEYIFCSYPTYEEWKPVSTAAVPIFAFGSYPTYEEWKRLR